MIKSIIKHKNLNIKKISEQADIPYSTLHELVSGVTDYKKCSIETFIKLSNALNMTVEELYKLWDSDELDLQSFELFKSEMCQLLTSQNDFDFIENIIIEHKIEYYYKNNDYHKALYLLAMVDYLCNKNDIPLYNKYDDFRKLKLSVEIYPLSVIVLAAASDDPQKIRDAYKEKALNEFLKFNIIEGDIYDVA